MFHPRRYRQWAVYDVRASLAPSSRFEETLMVEAVQRLPQTFLDEQQWGDERTTGAIWIPVALHDRTLATIRVRMRSDEGYLRRLLDQILRDLIGLDAVNEDTRRSATHRDPPPDALRECLGRVAPWMALNWLHPHAAVRMAIRRLTRASDDLVFHELLADVRSSLVEAHLATPTKSHSQALARFVQDWGPLFIHGDAAPLDRSAVADMVGAPPSGAASRKLERVTAERRTRAAELRRKLIMRALELDGDGASRLLAAQLEFLACAAWQEEVRRVLTQRAYAHLRNRVNASP